MGVSAGRTRVPNVASALRRQRLFNLLDGEAGSRGAVVVGPPGSGKTTLAASYCNERGLATLWYQVDSSDEDPATLLRCIRVAAIQAGVVEERQIPSYRPHLVSSARTFAKAQLRALFEHVAIPFALVFDDLHEVPASASLIRFIADAIPELPTHGRVFLLSRTLRTGPVSRFVVNGELMCIGPDELRMNDAEARELAESYGRRPTADEAAAMNRRVHGWIAGMKLALRLPTSSDVLSESSTTADLFAQYLEAEVFSVLAPHELNLLMELALTPDEYVSRAQSPKESGMSALLERLAEAGLFVYRSGSEAGVFRLHPLFREMLASRARTVWAQEELSAHCLSRAMQLVGVGNVASACGLLRDARAWGELVNVCRVNGDTLLAEGHSRFLSGCLERIPLEIAASDPWCLYWLGASRLSFDPKAARGRFEIAYGIFMAKGDVCGAMTSWAGVFESIFNAYDDLAALDGWFEDFKSLWEPHLEKTPPPLRARLTLGAFLALLFRYPHHADLPRWAGGVRQLVSQAPDAEKRSVMLAHLSTYYTWTAQYGHAAEILRIADAESTTVPLSPGRQLFHVACAGYHMHRGDHAACQQASDDGLELANATTVRLWDSILAGHGVTAAQTLGDRDESQRRLAAMRSIGASTNQHVSHYNALMAWHQLLIERPHHARDYATLAVEHVRAGGVNYIQAACCIAMAFVLHCAGDVEEAELIRALGRQTIERIKSHYLDWVARLFDALQLRSRGGGDAGVSELERSLLSDGRSHGYRHFFFMPRQALAVLCADAMDASIEPDYVKDLISMHRLAAPAGRVPPPSWPFAVRVHCLGGFRIEVGGEPLSFKSKEQRTPLLLLKLIISLGGAAVPEAKVADLLWPDSSGDGALRALATTLSRLRKLLDDGCVERRGGKLTISRSIVWIDAWAVESLLQGECSDAELRRIRQLYQGHFLDGETLPWAIPLRDRLHTKFVRSILHASDRLHKAGEHAKALAVLEELLLKDASAEAIHAQIIRTLVALDRHGDALAAFEHCKRVLAESLGTTPSPATAALLPSRSFG